MNQTIMALKGIDIASYQSTLDASKVEADFVIVKATESVDYVNPYCDKHFQQALKARKKLGVYHFARNNKNSPEAEADFFLSNIKGYIGKAILILDWEEDNGGTRDVAWAKRWLDHVYKKTSIRPMIYMSESVVNAHNWSSVASDYGLWVAKYRDSQLDSNYDMSNAGTLPVVRWWKFYAIWQWTSSGRLDGYNGNLDCNIFYGDKAAWDSYAGNKKVVTPAPVVPAPKPTSKPVPKPTPAPSPDTTELDKLKVENKSLKNELVQAGLTVKQMGDVVEELRFKLTTKNEIDGQDFDEVKAQRDEAVEKSTELINLNNILINQNDALVKEVQSFRKTDLSGTLQELFVSLYKKLFKK